MFGRDAFGVILIGAPLERKTRNRDQLYSRPVTLADPEILLMTAPSPKNLVWAVTKAAVDVSMDPDPPLRAGKRTSPYHMTHLAYEPLTMSKVFTSPDGVRYARADELLPRLAESWTPSDDYQTWTFHIRRGVRSPAGNMASAKDVKWGWERAYALRGVGLWRSRRMGGLASPDDIEILDEHTIRFRLVGPNPQFGQYFVFATNNIVDTTGVLSKTNPGDDPWASDWLSKNATGYGAFTVDSWMSDHITFAARDDYWAGRPGLDTVTLVPADSREQAFQMMERGEVSFLSGLLPFELARFENRPEYTTWLVYANHATLEFDWTQPPFDSPLVRRAISLCVPYRRLIDEAYRGHAWPGRSPVGPFCAHYTDTFWRYDTDVAAARRLLAEAGNAAGFSCELFIKGNEESRRLAEILVPALREIGIDAAIRLDSEATPGVRPPFWLKDDCGHALSETMYDLGHDYDPPRGMWGGRHVRNDAWIDQLKGIRHAPSVEQHGMYLDFQREILDFAPCVHLVELQAGVVLRGDIDPWACSPDSLALTSTVWTGDRQLLP
jgi:peptide/nickel transport system substrate-binding protein